VTRTPLRGSRGRAGLRRSAVTLPLIAVVMGCAGMEGAAPGRGTQVDRADAGATPTPYRPDRRDYATFREAHPGLLEPNYLPFMVHRVQHFSAAGDALVFCRWSDAQMPIRVHVVTPAIPESLQDEFRPRSPAEYRSAAESALQVWEDALEGRVRFQLSEEPNEADLQLRLLGERAPTPSPDKQRLGAAEALVHACRAGGWADDAQRMQVDFSMPEIVIYLADQTGLLPTEVVRRTTLHELGHALGMRGHSPSPGDLMYPILANSPGRDALSLQDVNSFLALYWTEPGAHFADVWPGEAPPRPPPAPPSGAPSLAMAPYVDAGRGFELRLPEGWIPFEEPRGVFASNGPSWDYDASLRLFFWPSTDIEAFLDCCTRAMLAETWLRQRSRGQLNHHRTLEMTVEDAAGEWARHYFFVEIADERVVMIASESPVDYAAQWGGWFRASLETLEIDGFGSFRGLFPSPGEGTPGAAPQNGER